MELQKGHFFALADGKGRNGFEKTRHKWFFFKSTDCRSLHTDAILFPLTHRLI